MPARRFSSINSWRWERTSWSRSCSTRPFKKRFRRKLLAFATSSIQHLYDGLRCFQSLGDGPGNSAPPLGFGFELLLTRFGQAVVFRTAIVFGVTPKRGCPAFFLHTVKGGKEGARLNYKGAAGNLL